MVQVLKFVILNESWLGSRWYYLDLGKATQSEDSRFIKLSKGLGVPVIVEVAAITKANSLSNVIS